MSRRRGIKSADPKLIAWLLIFGIPVYLFAKCQNWTGEPKKYTYEPVVTTVATSNLPEPEISLLPEDEAKIASISESIAEVLAGIDAEFSETVDPISASAGELIAEIADDVDAAREKYLHNWIEVEGVIWDVYYSSVGTVHYNYGGGVEGSYKIGELNRIIDDVSIKSGLIYWLTDDGEYKTPMMVAEMNVQLCETYYNEKSRVTVVGYCESVTENNVVLTDGRYPAEEKR